MPTKRDSPIKPKNLTAAQKAAKVRAAAAKRNNK